METVLIDGSGAAVDSFLADQFLVYMAAAGGRA
jgi:RNA 3'-terminal phosphate cyclase